VFTRPRHLTLILAAALIGLASRGEAAVVANDSLSVSIMVTIAQDQIDGPKVSPKIVSEAKLWVLEGDTWEYDVEVDVSKLRSVSHALTDPFNLVFSLPDKPSDMTIVKLNSTKARVRIPRATADGSDTHRRVRVKVRDTIGKGSNEQEVLLHITDLPTLND
jgi:hypothetical protein